MHIWTENPLTEIWSQLRYLKYPINTRRLLIGEIKSNRDTLWPDSEDLEKRSHEVAACIRQADEYFSASEHVGLATKPLLLFYGAQSLAKALITASVPGTGLASFHYHGLTMKPNVAVQDQRDSLAHYSNTPSLWRIDSEYAIANYGVFPRLAEAAGDSSPPKGTVLRLQELFRCLPDLAQLYSRHYSEPSHCFYLYNRPAQDEHGHYAIYFSQRENVDDILSVFPEFKESYELVSKHGHPGFRSRRKISQLPGFGVVERGTVAGEYLVRPYACGIHRSLTISYAILHILGMVVRYKPAFWMNTMGNDETGAVSLVEVFCTLARRRFPNDILDELWNERFTFGTPGYLA